jgi:hypothetical protein
MYIMGTLVGMRNLKLKFICGMYKKDKKIKIHTLQVSYKVISNLK